MALIFTSPLANVCRYQCFYLQSGANLWDCTIFSGTQPTAAQITSSWATYSANYLCHWTDVAWQTPIDTNVLDAAQLLSANIPTARAAFRTGTASWAILWNYTPNVSEAAVQGASLPSTAFWVVPVTDNAGNGVLKLTTTSIVSGTSYQPNDITIRVSLI
jgi:hypothetical protein